MAKESYDFDEILRDVETYTDAKESLKARLNADFSLRKQPAELIIGKKAVDMTVGRVFVNMLVLKPFVLNGVPVIEEDLFMDRYVTQDALEKYFNYMLTRLHNALSGTESYDEIRDSFAKAMNDMTDLSGNYNVLAGHSISYRDFVKLEVEHDDEVHDLFYPNVKAGPYDSIEKQFNECGAKLMNFYKTHKDNDLHPFVTSGTGIAVKQFQQCAGFVGLKPDVDGTVIPVVIKDNFIHGLSNLENYYINCKGTRLALLTNNKQTRRSGYLTRKLSLSNIDHYHDNNIEDCGTTHYVVFNVDNNKKFNQILGRHYYDIDENNEKITGILKTVTEDLRQTLVGRKIGLRSPVTCCGKHVCATCYGKELSEINKDVNTGLVATNKLTEPLTQRLLSAKHLLTTNTDSVDWGDTFTDVFQVKMDSIYFQEDVEASISFDKPKLEDFDEDEEMYVVRKLKILTDGTKKYIDYESPVDLYINNKFLPTEKMKDDDTTITIQSKQLDSEEYVFKYHPKNNELTRSLQEILDLVENSEHLGITDYNDFINKFDDLLIENGLDYINSVHIEMITAVLIRDAKTGKRLDFSKKDLDDYTIERVSKSVMDGPLATSLAFERLNDQFIDLKTYGKNEESMLDALYR